jgi:hypothetical protein
METTSQTPRTDAETMDGAFKEQGCTITLQQWDYYKASDGDVVMADFARQLETELNEKSDALQIISDREAELIAKYCRVKDQLHRICKDGFDMQDTIGMEPADDYVLRQIEKMRDAMRQLYDMTEGYADGAPDASPHDRLCNEVAAKLQPFIKP